MQFKLSSYNSELFNVILSAYGCDPMHIPLKTNNKATQIHNIRSRTYKEKMIV
jgi:hypothetical protein